MTRLDKGFEPLYIIFHMNRGWPGWIKRTPAHVCTFPACTPHHGQDPPAEIYFLDRGKHLLMETRDITRDEFLTIIFHHDEVF
jgi:hypothetical protein